MMIRYRIDSEIIRQAVLGRDGVWAFVRRTPENSGAGRIRNQLCVSLDRKAVHSERRRTIAFRNDAVAKETTTAGDADVCGIRYRLRKTLLRVHWTSDLTRCRGITHESATREPLHH